MAKPLGMKLRIVALPAVLALALVGATSSSAAPGNDIVDAKGDAVGGQAAYDILGVDFNMTTTTTKTVQVVKGKKQTITTVKPKNVVVTMQLAGAPSQQPGMSYQIGAETDCGHLYVFHYEVPGAGPESRFYFTQCGEPDPTETDGAGNFEVPTVAAFVGNTVTFTVSAKALPKEITAKSTFTELLAYTAPTEPVFGYSNADFVPETATDFATGDFAKLG